MTYIPVFVLRFYQVLYVSRFVSIFLEMETKYGSLYAFSQEMDTNHLLIIPH